MARSVNVSNDDDVIDSRDVIARLRELEDERQENADGGDPGELEAWDDEFGDELKALRAFNEEGENVGGDWTHGATCIRESYFEEYARELTADVGDLPRDLPAYLVIDWAATADNLKADYSEIDFGGVTYFVR
jgi:hypothetical protein